MAAILVDYENVGNANGLRGVDVLQETDTLVIFYSGCCGKIRYDYMQEIKCSGCRFKVVKLKEAGKNALDFFQMNAETKKVQVVRAGNIETALTFFTMPEEDQRRKILKNRMFTLDLAAECARIEERNKVQKEIRELLQGTAYTERTAEIIDFIDERKNCEKKEWYTGSLHRFGRKDGTVIYRLLKME